MITFFLRLSASEMHQKMKELDVVSNLLKQPQKVSHRVLGHHFIITVVVGGWGK